jgi:signal transduction histidine kinase
MVEIAKTKGSGWEEYPWPHPLTKKIQVKRAYVAKIPGYDGFLAVGIYK